MVEKHEELGRGAFGTVYKGIYLGKNGDSPMECAIKTIREDATTEQRNEFLMEAHKMK